MPGATASKKTAREHSRKDILAGETSALCAKSWTLIACPQRAPVIYCIYVRVFGPAGAPRYALT